MSYTKLKLSEVRTCAMEAMKLRGIENCDVDYGEGYIMITGELKVRTITDEPNPKTVTVQCFVSYDDDPDVTVMVYFDDMLKDRIGKKSVDEFRDSYFQDVDLRGFKAGEGLQYMQTKEYEDIDDLDKKLGVILQKACDFVRSIETKYTMEEIEEIEEIEAKEKRKKKRLVKGIIGGFLAFLAALLLFHSTM